MTSSTPEKQLSLAKSSGEWHRCLKAQDPEYKISAAEAVPKPPNHILVHRSVPVKLAQFQHPDWNLRSTSALVLRTQDSWTSRFRRSETRHYNKNGHPLTRNQRGHYKIIVLYQQKTPKPRKLLKQTNKKPQKNANEPPHRPRSGPSANVELPTRSTSQQK